MFQLSILFTTGQHMSIDVPNLTVAHEIRRSFNSRIIEDWSVTPILVA